MLQRRAKVRFGPVLPFLRVRILRFEDRCLSHLPNSHLQKTADLAHLTHSAQQTRLSVRRPIGERTLGTPRPPSEWRHQTRQHLSQYVLHGLSDRVAAAGHLDWHKVLIWTEFDERRLFDFVLNIKLTLFFELFFQCHVEIWTRQPTNASSRFSCDASSQ